MAKNEQQEAFEKILSANFARVVEFIKFAEAKNAALLTFCSFWMLAIFKSLSGSEPLPSGYGGAYKVSVLLFSIAAVMAIFSFRPSIGLSTKVAGTGRKKSLLFFGDISSMGTEEFKETVKKEAHASRRRNLHRLLHR